MTTTRKLYCSCAHSASDHLDLFISSGLVYLLYEVIKPREMDNLIFLCGILFMGHTGFRAEQ